jgi:hypothetical protein
MYDEAWQDLRWRRRLGLASFIAFFPIAYCSGMLAAHFHRDWIFMAGGVSTFGSMLAAGVYHQTFRCPRCRRFFFVGLYPRSWRALFNRACSHCGLRIFAHGTSREQT